MASPIDASIIGHDIIRENPISKKIPGITINPIRIVLAMADIFIMLKIHSRFGALPGGILLGLLQRGTYMIYGLFGLALGLDVLRLLGVCGRFLIRGNHQFKQNADQ